MESCFFLSLYSSVVDNSCHVTYKGVKLPFWLLFHYLLHFILIHVPHTISTLIVLN